MWSIFFLPRVILGLVTVFGIRAHGAEHIAAATCGQTLTAKPGDTCASLASAAGITVAQFLRGNPGVISCSALTTGTRYCVDPEYSATPSTTTSGLDRPTGPGAPLEVTQDGKCGDGLTCLGSSFGQCCSEHGWCGRTTDHCGATCQAEFGLCGSAGLNPSSTATTTPLPPTSSTTSVRGGDNTITETVTKTTSIIQTKTQTETLQQPITSTQTIVATVPGPGTTATTTATATATTTQTIRITNTITSTSTLPPGEPITATATATATQTIRLTQTLVSISISTSTLPITIQVPVTITAPGPGPGGEATATATRTILATIIAGTTTVVQLRTSTTLIPITSVAYVTERSVIFTSSTITTIKTITITNAAMCSSRTLGAVPGVTNSAVGTRIPSSSGAVKRVGDVDMELVNHGVDILPIQNGVVSECQTFHRVKDGDTCEGIVEKHKGSLDIEQFYAWNTKITDDCRGLWLGYWVCVGI